jgi:predicted nicotinamide N-methyase
MSKQRKAPHEDDEVDDDDDNVQQQQATGYCHHNEDGSSVRFDISLWGVALEIHQDPDSRTLGHGAVVWDSAVIFSKYLEHNPSACADFHGKKVIELGAGCGLSGIAAMMKGCAVTLTDMAKVTESLTTANAQRIYSQLTSQGSGAFAHPLLRPAVFPLDWTDWESFETLGGAAHAPFDILITTDCVFSVSLVEPLVSCLRKLSGKSSVIYCCHEIRDEEANAYFLVELGKWFAIKRINRGKLHPQFKNDLVELLVAKPLRSTGAAKGKA